MNEKNEECFFLDWDDRRGESADSEQLRMLAEKVIREALLVIGIVPAVQLGIAIVDNVEIHGINKEYRGVDASTDVLSFPMIDYDISKGIHPGDIDPETKAAMLGDIIISVERAHEQAIEYGHAFEREFAFLTAHGILHLLGYDHEESDQAEKEMFALQETILKAVGLMRAGTGAKENEIVFGADDWQKALLLHARRVMENAYAPYSKYQVGAAVLTAAGEIITGANIENASYGLSMCGERVAVCKAVSEGKRGFSAVAVASNGEPPWPCGACRQVLHEFAPELIVVVSGQDGKVYEKSLRELLPEAFELER